MPEEFSDSVGSLLGKFPPANCKCFPTMAALEGAKPARCTLGFKCGNAVGVIVTAPALNRIIASSGKRLNAWDSKTGAGIWLSESDADVRSAAWSPGRAELLTGDEAGYLHAWDIANGKKLRSVRLKHMVMGLAVAPGDTVFSGDLFGTVTAWDTSYGTWDTRCQFECKDHLLALAIAPEQQWVCTADGMGNTASVWDARHRSGCKIQELECKDWVLTVAWVPEKNFVVSGDEAHMITCWDALNGQVLWELDCAGPAGSVCYVALQGLVVCPDDEDMHVVRVTDGAVISTIKSAHAALPDTGACQVVSVGNCAESLEVFTGDIRGGVAKWPSVIR